MEMKIDGIKTKNQMGQKSPKEKSGSVSPVWVVVLLVLLVLLIILFYTISSNVISEFLPF